LSDALDRANRVLRFAGSQRMRCTPADDQLTADERGDAGHVRAKFAVIVERDDRMTPIANRGDDRASGSEIDSEPHVQPVARVHRERVAQRSSTFVEMYMRVISPCESLAKPIT
jgi:hypothetical protein